MKNKKSLYLILPFVLYSCSFSNYSSVPTQDSIKLSSEQSNQLISKPAGNLDPAGLVAKPSGNLDPKKFTIIKNSGYANITLSEEKGYELSIFINLSDFNIKATSIEQISNSDYLEIKLNIDGVEKIFNVEKEHFIDQKTFSIFLNGITPNSNIKLNLLLKDKNNIPILEKEVVETNISQNKSLDLKLSKADPSKYIENNNGKNTIEDIVSNDNNQDNIQQPITSPTPSTFVSSTPIPTIIETTTPILSPSPTSIISNEEEKYNLDKVIFANNNINMSGSPYIYSDSDILKANIHSNNNILISGVIEGNITYFNSLTKDSNNTTTGDINKHNKITFPTINTSIPSTNKTISQNDVYTTDSNSNNEIIISNTTINGINGTFSIKSNLFKNGGTKTIVLENVVINGDLNISGSNNINVVIKDTVYVKGNTSLEGAVNLDASLTTNLLISEGSITFSGSSSCQNLNNNILFVSKSNSNMAIQIKDASKVNGILYTEKNTSSINISGSPEIFGAIISNGDVILSGAPRIKMNNNLSNFMSIFN